ncbi:hypothetical protein DASB73_019700 [Starmerella bacillaris]|uniref:Uncharacterized protein n=1 Tax=Starmerella bacillaris TaxID=1247836 RepID=A0AAV5RIT3_STABA|nr:hypothetical protein DASB73_019700 [Starmerella bacillaris]
MYHHHPFVEVVERTLAAAAAAGDNIPAAGLLEEGHNFDSHHSLSDLDLLLAGNTGLHSLYPNNQQTPKNRMCWIIYAVTMLLTDTLTQIPHKSVFEA